MSTRPFVVLRTPIPALVLVATAACWAGAVPPAFASKAKPNVYEAILEEPAQSTPEISTNELKAILAQGTEIVFDARPKD